MAIAGVGLLACPFTAGIGCALAVGATTGVGIGVAITSATGQDVTADGLMRDALLGAVGGAVARGVAVGVGRALSAAGVSKFGDLTHSAHGIAPCSTQRTITAGQGSSTQDHHLIEKRFVDVMGGNTDTWPTIVVTRAEHQVFTNAWREAIPYGTGTRTATRAQVEDAARVIYQDYPEILMELGLG